MAFLTSSCSLWQDWDGRGGVAEPLSCWFRLQKTWHHPAEVPPRWALQAVEELGEHGVQGRDGGAESRHGRGGEGRGPWQGLPATSRIWSNLGPGPRERRRFWEGNMPCVFRVAAPPRSPGTMTARAEMMVSSCGACRQGRGIQSEGRVASSTSAGWRGKSGVCRGSLLAGHGQLLGSRGQGWCRESSGEVPVGQDRALWTGQGGKCLGSASDSQHHRQAQISG